MPGIGFGSIIRDRLQGLGGGFGDLVAKAGKGERYEPPEKGGAPGAAPGGKTLPVVGPVGGLGGGVVSYLQNPIVLVAVAVGLYFLLKKFKVF